MNCATYSITHTGKKALIATSTGLSARDSRYEPVKSIQPLTSKQYPNSSCSPPPACANNPCCFLLPGSPAIPGPNNRPTRKKAIVAMIEELAKKWTNTKIRMRRMTEAGDGSEAIPQARPVRSMKKERR